MESIPGPERDGNGNRFQFFSSPGTGTGKNGNEMQRSISDFPRQMRVLADKIIERISTQIALESKCLLTPLVEYRCY